LLWFYRNNILLRWFYRNNVVYCAFFFRNNIVYCAGFTRTILFIALVLQKQSFIALFL